MHWYFDYVTNYRNECKNNEYGLRKCRHSNCEWCNYFLEHIECDLGYRKDVKPYLYPTITAYREACAKSREVEEKHKVFNSLPNPFLKHNNIHNFDSSFKELSWSEIRALESMAACYKEYRKSISIKVAVQTKTEYERAYQLEKEKPYSPPKKTPNQEDQKNIVNVKSQIVFRECKKCGCRIFAPEIYCSACDPYIDLHLESSKLDTNLGAFRSKAPLFAPSMRPIDVPASEYTRFENATYKEELLEDKYINPPKMPDRSPPVKTKNTSQLHLNIQSEYEAKAYAIIAKYSKHSICADESLFYELAVALRISGHRNTLTEVVDEYALQNYQKNTKQQG